MILKRLNLLLVAIIFFLLTFGFSFFIFDSTLVEQGIPTATLEEINVLSRVVNDALEKRETLKNTTLQEMINTEKYGDFRLLYRDWKVKLFKTGDVRPKPSNVFFSRIGESEFSLKVPVGKYEVKGILVVTRKIPPARQSSDQIFFQILFSASLTLLLLAFIVWIKIRNIVKPIDHLCKEFSIYRRKEETGPLPPRTELRHQSRLERRVEILESLWKQFQSIQSQLTDKQAQLTDKIHELELSEKAKEKTIRELEIAQEQEQRLAELGVALAEFGHDIGNANGAILSFVDLLFKLMDKETITAMDLTRSLMFIRRVKIASTTISGLTSDILEFAKGKTELKIGTHSLQECISRLEVNLGFIEELPQCDYPPEDLMLSIDDSKIIRVIVNLVKNAWDKLEDEEDAAIRIAFIPDSSAGITVTVTDNGYPIPDDMLPHLFQPFKTQGKEKGTGLGLAICQKIIEAHGGRITAENLADQSGVCFSFYLPHCVNPLPGEQPEPSSSLSGNTQTPHASLSAN
ncbi:MAG: HAMP domain-containing histidine kinase [SAR324 cluster bacterium]|nr:HAMP domain-containing histidine kinase [SAR324 cluster bacterium]